MNRCHHRQPEIQLYLDNELPPPRSLELERHLMDCAACRAVFQELRAVVDLVRGAQPLYDAPEASIQNARSVVALHERSNDRTLAAVAAAVVGVLGLLLVSTASGEFSAFAADSHLRYAKGAMPLDVVSSEPEVVSQWLGARLPFHLQLPNYPEGAGEPKRYRLEGARLLQYQNRDVAFLAYEMDRKPISLLMTSDPVATPSSGTIYRSGALKFHFSDRNGLRLISWTDRGIHYSLVSELGVRGAESCIICHGSAGQRRLIDELKPHSYVP